MITDVNPYQFTFYVPEAILLKGVGRVNILTFYHITLQL